MSQWLGSQEDPWGPVRGGAGRAGLEGPPSPHKWTHRPLIPGRRRRRGLPQASSGPVLLARPGPPTPVANGPRQQGRGGREPADVLLRLLQGPTPAKTYDTGKPTNLPATLWSIVFKHKGGPPRGESGLETQRLTVHISHSSVHSRAHRGSPAATSPWGCACTHTLTSSRPSDLPRHTYNRTQTTSNSTSSFPRPFHLAWGCSLETNPLPHTMCHHCKPVGPPPPQDVPSRADTC